MNRSLGKNLEQESPKLPMLHSSSLTLGLGRRSAKLPGVVLSDVSITPDVEMVLLGVAHRLFVTFHQLFQLSTPLPLHKEQTVLDEVLADILVPDVYGDEGVCADLVLNVQLDSLVEDILSENLHSLRRKLFILNSSED